MDWIAHRGSDVLLRLVVPETFLEWLAARSSAPMVTQMDPYRDTTLDAVAQAAWLRMFEHVRSVAADEARREHERRSNLPRDPAAREEILGRLVERTLGQDEHQQTMMELHALLELALDSGAIVQVLGD